MDTAWKPGKPEAQQIALNVRYRKPSRNLVPGIWWFIHLSPPDLGGGNSNIFGIFTSKIWGRWSNYIQFDYNHFQRGWHHQVVHLSPPGSSTAMLTWGLNDFPMYTWTAVSPGLHHLWSWCWFFVWFCWIVGLVVFLEVVFGFLQWSSEQWEKTPAIVARWATTSYKRSFNRINGLING